MPATSAFTLDSVVAILSISASQALAPATTAYQKPPTGIVALLNAPPSPVTRIFPNRTMLAIEQPSSFPTIGELGHPQLQLAHLRYTSGRNHLSGGAYGTSLFLQSIASGTQPTPVKVYSRT